MKKIMKLFVYVAAAAMTLASCQKNEIDNQVPQEYEYTFLIGNADTKAVIGDESVVWEDGDQMGVYTKVASGTISKNAYGDITPGSPATMKMYSDQALAIGDYVYAYYPYNSDNEDRNLMVTLSIPSVQDGKDDMPMVAIPYCVESAIGSGQQDAPAGKIKFANLGAVIEFNVYSKNTDYLSEKVQSVTYDAGAALAGNFEFDLTSVNYANQNTLKISGYEATSVVSTLAEPVVVGSSKEDAAKVKMVVAPGSYAGTISVKTDKATYTYNIATPKEYTRSSLRPLGADLAKGTRTAATTEEYTIQWDSASDWTDMTLSSGYYTVKAVKNNGSTAPTINSTKNDCRVYAKGSVIVTHSAANIKKLVFNISAKGKEQLADITASVGDVTIDTNNWKVIWEGDASSVTFTVGDKSEYGTEGKDKSGQLCFTSINAVAETTDAPIVPVLKEIKLSGMTTEYELNAEFSFDGTVTASYTVGDDKAVEPTEVSSPDMTTAGTKEVTVKYTEAGVTCEAKYSINVTDPNAGGNEGGETTEAWTLVTDASTLAVGDEIVIVAPEANYAMGADKGNNRNAAGVSKSGNTVEINDDVQIITLQAGNKSNTFAFYTGSGYLYAASSSNNYLKTKNTLDDNGSWSISIASDGLATITANGSYTRNTMRFNPNNDSPLFSCYASTQTLGTLVSIYKHVGANEGGGETPEPEQPKTLVSIAVSGQTTSYTVGDTFAFDGTVTATYSDRSTAEVEPTSVSTPNMTTEGEQAVTVTYTEGEETKTATYTITVTAAVEPEEPGEVIETTIADFLAAGVSETVWYQLTGKIKEIKNTTYGNFYLEDATGYVYVYGLTSEQVDSNDKSFSSLGLEEGDLVTLIGTRAYYANASEDQKDQVGGPAYYVSHLNFEVTPKVINVGAADTEAEFNVSCDAGYLPEYPNGVEELSVVSSSDVAYDTYKVKFLANETAEPKTYVISIKADVEGFNIEKTVTINQAGVPQEGGEEGDDVSGTVLYSEDFSSLTSWSTANKTTIQVNGVTYTSAGGNMYEQNGCLKFGKGSGASNVGVKLPTISSLSSATNVVLKFRAVSSDAAYTLKVSGTNCTVGTLSPSAITKHSSSINDGKNTQSALQQAFENSKVFTVDITDMTSSSVISIVANGSAKRWYIDDIEIVTN